MTSLKAPVFSAYVMSVKLLPSDGIKPVIRLTSRVPSSAALPVTTSTSCSEAMAAPQVDVMPDTEDPVARLRYKRLRLA